MSKAWIEISGLLFSADIDPCMKILSFDASTATIGIGVCEFDGYTKTLIHHDYYKPDKEISQLQMLLKIRNMVIDLLNTYKPDVVAIEEFIQYMKGGSGAKTIIPLAVVNRTICLTILEKTGKEPMILNVNTIRAKIKFAGVRLSKEDIPSAIAHHFGLQDFPWRYKTNRKKVQTVMEESYDVADGIAVGLAAWIILNPPPKIKKERKKK